VRSGGRERKRGREEGRGRCSWEERHIARRVIILRRGDLFPPLLSLDRWVRARSIEREKEKEKENRVDHRTSTSEKPKNHWPKR
jgi:hypothetical protein